MALKNNLSKEILKGLEEWAGKEAHSSRFLAFYLRLLSLQAEAESRLGLPEVRLDKPEIERRLRQGLPLLRSSELELDWEQVAGVFGSLSTLLAEHPEIMGAAPASLTRVEVARIREWVKTWLAGGELPLELDGEDIPPLVLATLIQQATRPFLIGYAQALKGGFDQDLWRRALCPVCSSKPEFACLEKEAGARWLLCSTCSYEWLFERTRCPCCGNSDNRSLSYLTSEDGVYRLYLCQSCKSYLKAVDLRKGRGETPLPLEALTTIALDRQAQELGYHRG